MSQCSEGDWKYLTSWVSLECVKPEPLTVECMGRCEAMQTQMVNRGWPIDYEASCHVYRTCADTLRANMPESCTAGQVMFAMSWAQSDCLSVGGDDVFLEAYQRLDWNVNWYESYEDLGGCISPCVDAYIEAFSNGDENACTDLGVCDVSECDAAPDQYSTFCTSCKEEFFKRRGCHVWSLNAEWALKAIPAGCESTCGMVEQLVPYAIWPQCGKMHHMYGQRPPAMQGGCPSRRHGQTTLTIQTMGSTCGTEAKAIPNRSMGSSLRSLSSRVVRC